MKLESRRERELRLRKQRRSSILGMALMFGLVIVVAVSLLLSSNALKKKNEEYEAQKAKLEQQLTEQQERKSELEEYKKYVQTKKFVEEVAKDKFGLLYPDEIVFKPEDTQ